MDSRERQKQLEIYEYVVGARAPGRKGKARSAAPNDGDTPEWMPLSAMKGEIRLAVMLFSASGPGGQAGGDVGQARVGLFMCEDHSSFPNGTAAWHATVTLLSAVYLHTGGFSLKFWKLGFDDNKIVETEGRIPREICQLAEFLKCDLPGANRSAITDAEGRKLFICLARLSGDTVSGLTGAGLGDGQDLLLQAVLLLRSGVWLKQSLEYIARYSLSKQSVLCGRDDLLYLEAPTSMQDLDLLEIAIAGERACGWIAWHSKDSDFPFVPTWENHRTLVVTPGRGLEVVPDHGEKISIEKGSSLRFLLVPGYPGYYELVLPQILEELESSGPVVLVVTENMRLAANALAIQQAALETGRIAGVFYLPESVEEVSSEVRRRLFAARSICG